MKILFTISLILVYFQLNAQDLKKINSDLGISDSLMHPIEIRVYQFIETTNYSSLFIMYKDFSENWLAEFYQHWREIEGVTELKTEKRTLSSKSDLDYIYLNMVRSFIFDLPSLNEIKWKLVKRGSVEKVESRVGNEVKLKYDLTGIQAGILDGISYRFFAKNNQRNNEFYFSNPEAYNRLYPEIDEPIFVNELIEIIRNEFEIWEK